MNRKQRRSHSDPNTLTLNLKDEPQDGPITLDREIVGEDDLYTAAQPVKPRGPDKRFLHKLEGEDADDGQHAEEEEEELAIQMDKDLKADLQDSDFLVPGLDDSIVADQPAAPATKASGITIETVEREFTKLSKAEKLKVLCKDSPELLPLLSEYKANMKTVKQILQPLLEKAKAGLLPKSEGLSFLQMKFHLLVLYCLHIAFYMLIKVEGRRVKDHPVVEKLVELRLYIQKLAPLEKKLQYTINKLLSLANISVEEVDKAEKEDDEEGEDSLPEVANLRPRLDRMLPVEVDQEVEQKIKEGIYQAPKDQRKVTSDENKTKKQKRAAERLLADIKEYEDNNMKEYRLSKDQKKLLKKAAQDAKLSHVNVVAREESFDPNAEDLDDEDLTLLQFIEKRKKAALRAQRDLEREKGETSEVKILDGEGPEDPADDEEITSEDTGEGSEDEGRGPKGVRGEGGDNDNDDDGDNADDGEDQVYKKAKEAQTRKKMKVEEKKRKRENVEEEAEAEEDAEEGGGRRKATKKIIKNRGLVASKKKSLRTPRVKTRMRYKKQLRKHHSQVPQVKESQYNTYSGENIIKDKMIRSKPL